MQNRWFPWVQIFDSLDDVFQVFDGLKFWYFVIYFELIEYAAVFSMFK